MCNKVIIQPLLHSIITPASSTPVCSIYRYYREIFCVLLLFFISISTVSANDLTDAKSRLQKVQQEILALQEKRARTKGKAGQLQQRLSKVESQIGRITHQRRDNRMLLQREKENLTELRVKRDNLRQELDKQSIALANQVRATYRLGRQEKLRMLFNQQDPATVGRMLTYYSYFNHRRADEITITRNTLAALHSTEQKIAQQTARLEEIATRLAQQQNELESTRTQRQEVLSSLEREIVNSGKQIASLENNQSTLETLVTSLKNTLKSLPKRAPAELPFNKLKGRIPWPVQGKVNNRFGKPRGTSDSGLKWRGITIESKSGGDVRAISQGTVVFSDWMNGYGLLLIIDHGDSFMSLYGQNESLFKATGDPVLAGEQIAQVGNSGGINQNGLYFEIRHKGKPLNPASWCSSNIRQAGR